MERTCPDCGAPIPVMPGFPDWCDRCEWNLVRPPPRFAGGRRFARLADDLGRRAGERMANELRALERPAPDGILVDSRWNASWAVAGLRRRPRLTRQIPVVAHDFVR